MNIEKELFEDIDIEGVDFNQKGVVIYLTSQEIGCIYLTALELELMHSSFIEFLQSKVH